jgi:hypothetical protein
MDACTYESITGLRNYYGFKSLLKNGGWTQRYSCDDDTIVFNRIESFTWNGGGFSLNANQVGVVLNCTNIYTTVGVSVQVENVQAKDVDNQTIYINPTSEIKGIVITNTFTNTYGADPKNLVLAIFDLY